MKTINTTRIFILIAVMFVKTNVFGQQDPMYTQYMFNMSTINPAANGIYDDARFISVNRFQFVGIDGAPTTYSLSADVPVFKYNSGVGINYVFDKLGPERSNNIYLDYSYHINLTRDIKLGMGIKAGFKVYGADFSQIGKGDIPDEVFTKNINGDIMPNFGLGFMVYADNFYGGISSPKLVNHVLEGSDDASGAEERHFFIVGGYKWEINRDITFKPSLYMKMTRGVIPSVDVTANFQMYDRFIAGLAFRSYDAVSILAQVEVYEGIHVGYVYDISINKLRRGSHEIMLSYHTTIFKKRSNNAKFRR